MVEFAKPSKVSKIFSMVISRTAPGAQIMVNHLEQVSFFFFKTVTNNLTGLGGRSGRDRISSNDIQLEASDMMNNLAESDAQPVQM